MSCGSCLCGVPPVETVDDLPPVGTSGLCEGAMRIVESDGSLWVLVRDASLSPVGNPLRREWRRVAPAADDLARFKWAGTYAPDGVGPVTRYMTDDSDDGVMSILPPSYPLVPPATAIVVRRFAATVTTNTLSAPFFINLFVDGLATPVVISVGTGATGAFIAPAVPTAIATTDGIFNVVVVGEGQAEASAFFSVVLDMTVPRP